MTQRICEIRDTFSQKWHANAASWSGLKNFGFDSPDQYHAFCTAKDWLQDTGEALYCHRKTGFSRDPWQAYIEFWGVMQAVVIQQDAISELNFAVHGFRLNPKTNPQAWKTVRRLRNVTVGHPNSKTHGEAANVVVRTITGRQQKTYNRIHVYYHSGKDAHQETVNLGALIDAYEACAAAMLLDLFVRIEERTNC